MESDNARDVTLEDTQENDDLLIDDIFSQVGELDASAETMDRICRRELLPCGGTIKDCGSRPLMPGIECFCEICKSVRCIDLIDRQHRIAVLVWLMEDVELMVDVMGKYNKNR